MMMMMMIEMMRNCLLSREVPGFVLNRMQYSLLNECWRLIRDGVVSPQDLDVVMKDGMGMRYAFMGPMETIHLNAEGTQNYCDRYGETIFNVSSDLGPVPSGWKYGDFIFENKIKIY